VYFGAVHENRRAFESATTLTFRGTDELEARPVAIGDALEPLLDVADGVAFAEIDGEGAAFAGDGDGDGDEFADAPAVTLIRGQEGYPEPSEETVLT
jgi:hypothetical protein